MVSPTTYSIIPYEYNSELTPLSQRNTHASVSQKKGRFPEADASPLDSTKEYRYYVGPGYQPDTYNSRLNVEARDRDSLGMLINTYA
jgi:hypothetical protein